jgi:hypothetical protein
MFRCTPLRALVVIFIFAVRKATLLIPIDAFSLAYDTVLFSASVNFSQSI